MVHLKLKSLILISSVIFSTSALAQNTNPIIGSWKGTSNSAVIGSGLHHPTNNHGKADVEFRKNDYTITIDKVDGRNFSGTVTSKNYKELIAGAFKKDFKSGVIVNENGSATFELTSSNAMDLCFTQATPKFIAIPNVASCFELQKQ